MSVQALQHDRLGGVCAQPSPSAFVMPTNLAGWQTGSLLRGSAQIRRTHLWWCWSCQCWRARSVRADFREVDEDSNFSETQGAAVHWMAWTSSLNCLSCWNPYQTTDSLNCPPFHWKSLFFTEKCFVASPSQKLALKAEEGGARRAALCGDQDGGKGFAPKPLLFADVPGRLPRHRQPDLRVWDVSHHKRVGNRRWSQHVFMESFWYHRRATISSVPRGTLVGSRKFRMLQRKEANSCWEGSPWWGQCIQALWPTSSQAPARSRSWWWLRYIDSTTSLLCKVQWRR